MKFETRGDLLMKKTLALILAAMFILLAFAACGGEKTDDKDKTTKAGENTTAAAVQGVKIETDKFSMVVPDGWEKMDVDGGFQLYKMSGEIVEVHFRGFNQGATHAKLQVEGQAKAYSGTEAKEIELLGKTFWNTTITVNNVPQVFNACIEDGVMISVKYGGPNLDTNPDYMKIVNSVEWK